MCQESELETHLKSNTFQLFNFVNFYFILLAELIDGKLIWRWRAN